MSSRALKRLQRASGLNDLVVHTNGDEAENDVDDKDEKKRVNKKEQKTSENLFELLNGKDEDEDKEEDISDNEIIQQQQQRSQVKSKKKKKKNQIKKKEKENADVQRQPTLDDVEACIQEVNNLLGDLGSLTTESNLNFTVTVKPLLHIDYRNLNPEIELKRIFGSEIFRAEQSNRNRRQRNRPFQRSSRLVQFKETWPSTRGSGLSMKYIEQTQEFVFEHSLAYQKVQNKLEDAVDSIFVENIVDLFRENPYHIDALILVADSRRDSEDYEVAADCIERALYVLECAFHPMFNLASGNCFLSYKRAENRAFYICLFRHIWNLGRKRCNRTAFEFCKLLLSLDPVSDPLDCMSMIDYYALRSEQYDYLIRLEQEVMIHESMRQVPNFAMSIPLVHFKIAQRDQGDTIHADEKLQDSLLFFPMMLKPLLDECSVQPDKKVASHAFFTNVTELNDSSSELGSLVTMYVKRCMPCWKEVDVIAWLERNVIAVLDIVDKGTDPRVESYAKIRQQRFKHPPLRLLRHYYLSEISGLTLRQHHITGQLFSHDPFPPPDSIRAYARTPRPTVASQDHSGFLRSLLQSLLPSYNPNAPANVVPANDEEGATAQGISQQIQQSVTAVMQAMRQLINTSLATGAPQATDNHHDEGNNDDDEHNNHDEDEQDEDRE